MPSTSFRIINDISDIKLSDKWHDVIDLTDKGNIVDEKGKPPSSEYSGRLYQLIKKERNITGSEKFGRVLLGILAVIASFGLTLASKSVRHLFTDKKFAINYGLDLSEDDGQQSNDNIRTVGKEKLTSGKTTKKQDKPIASKEHSVDKPLEQFRNKINACISDLGDPEQFDFNGIRIKFIFGEDAVESIVKLTQPDNSKDELIKKIDAILNDIKNQFGEKQNCIYDASIQIVNLKIVEIDGKKINNYTNIDALVLKNKLCDRSSGPSTGVSTYLDDDLKALAPDQPMGEDLRPTGLTF